MDGWPGGVRNETGGSTQRAHRAQRPEETRLKHTVARFLQSTATAGEGEVTES